MRLGELLAIWRKAPNKELADLVVELGVHEAVAARWDDVDGVPPPEAITKLLEGVLEKGSVKGRERLVALAEWPLDPRIDRWVATLYADPPLTSSGSRPFWVRLVPLSKRILDTQAASTILKAREGLDVAIHWHAYLAGHIDRVRPKLVAAIDTPFAAKTRALIEDTRQAMREEVAAAQPERHADASALYAAVLANPADDGPRIVLGDVLQEQGDPRGELIALQMGAGDPKRERVIIKEHAVHLLGPLYPVLKDYAFKHGFLSHAVLKAGNAHALEIAITKVIGDPMWSTVEHLEGAPHPLVVHPVMKSLRSLANSKIRLVELAKLPNLVALTTAYSDDAWLKLTDGLAFPALKELSVHLFTRHAAALVGSPLVTRLAKLDLRVDVSSQVPQATEEAFDLLHRIHKLHVPDVTLRLVRYRDKDWHSAYRFTPGTVEVTHTASNDAHEPIIRADIVRATAILANLGRKVS